MIDIIIIGCGPAGISAAIQLRRYGYNFTVIERDQIGGLVKNADLVENYPGFPKGIAGKDLIRLFNEQLQHNDIKPLYEEATDLDYLNDLFYVKTQKSYLRSKYMIIASGTEPNILNLPNTNELVNKSIFYEIYAIISVTNKQIAVIGSGDCAFDYALNLSKHNNVTLFNRGSSPKCIPLLMERLKKNKNIVYMNRTSVLNILGTDSDMVKLEYYCDNEQTIKYNFYNYVIPAIGRRPANDFISERIYKNMKGLTKSKRLFLAGDIANDNCRQVGISVGNGIRSAMEIRNHMESAGQQR